jgi:hypothetical protein
MPIHLNFFHQRIFNFRSRLPDEKPIQRASKSEKRYHLNNTLEVGISHFFVFGTKQSIT